MYKVYLKRADERGSVVTDQGSKVITASPAEGEIRILYHGNDIPEQPSNLGEKNDL